MKRPHDTRCPYQQRGDIPDCCRTAVAFDATMAERERCAKIAEDNKAKSEDAWGAGCTYGATVIAKQIREGVWTA